MILYKKLKLTSKELCIDIYGEKGNRLNRRYWLTRETKPYKILAKYGLFYRPIENNIILNYYGNEIFLYDTYKLKKNKCVSNSYNFLIYLYNFNIGLKQTLKLAWYQFKNHFKK